MCFIYCSNRIEGHGEKKVGWHAFKGDVNVRFLFVEGLSLLRVDEIG